MKNVHYPSMSRSVRSGHTNTRSKVPLNHGPSHHLYNRYSVSTKESTSPIVFDIRGGKERNSRKTSLNILEQESTPSKDRGDLDEDEDANVSESYSGENKEIQYLTTVSTPNPHHKLKSASPSAKRTVKTAKIHKRKSKKTKTSYRARSDINVKYNELVKLPRDHESSTTMWPDTDHHHVPTFASAVLDLTPRREAYL